MSDNRKEFPCDVCGSENAIEVPHARLYTGNQPIHICTECGFVHVKYRRSAEEIAKTWSESLFGGAYTARIPAVVARQTFVADFIDSEIGLSGKTLCDIGAGEGQFLEIVRRDYGAEVFGIEASEHNSAILEKNNIEHFNGTIEDFATSDDATKREADIITVMWTLENCMSCGDMLGAAHSICKDDGYIAVATGSRILVPFKKPLDRYFSKNPSDTHSFRWSANTLTGILAMSGFEVKHINQYIDSDVMCVIAQKRPAGETIEWQKDDFMKVYDFFDRWHRESIYYR